jgi:hypothetical protein
MTVLRTAGRAGSLLIPLALAVAACSGATSSGAPSASSGGGGTSAAPTTAVATPTPAATSAGTSSAPSVAIALPSFDISQLTAGLANVNSYRVSITIAGVEQYKAIVVTKPVLSRDITMAGGMRIVVIGDEAWMGQAGAPLQAAPNAMATALFKNFDPTFLVGAYSGAGWAQSSHEVGTEQKNGVNAKHYHIDSTTIAGGFTGLPAGASIDVWIADEGYLVALETKGFPSGDMSIQVTGVDDPANKVERPS